MKNELDSINAFNVAYELHLEGSPDSIINEVIAEKYPELDQKVWWKLGNGIFLRDAMAIDEMLAVEEYEEETC